MTIVLHKCHLLIALKAELLRKTFCYFMTPWYISMLWNCLLGIETFPFEGRREDHKTQKAYKTLKTLQSERNACWEEWYSAWVVWLSTSCSCSCVSFLHPCFCNPNKFHCFAKSALGRILSWVCCCLPGMEDVGTWDLIPFHHTLLTEELKLALCLWILDVT